MRTIFVVRIARGEKSLFDEGTADVTTTDEYDDERILQRKALKKIPDEKKVVSGVNGVANEGVRSVQNQTSVGGGEAK